MLPNQFNSAMRNFALKIKTDSQIIKNIKQIKWSSIPKTGGSGFSKIDTWQIGKKNNNNQTFLMFKLKTKGLLLK